MGIRALAAGNGIGQHTEVSSPFAPVRCRRCILSFRGSGEMWKRRNCAELAGAQAQTEMGTRFESSMDSSWPALVFGVAGTGWLGATYLLIVLRFVWAEGNDALGVTLGGGIDGSDAG